MSADMRWLAGLPAPQARYWFAEKMSPGSPDSMDSFTFLLHGPVDEARLRAALRAVVSAHTALRTRIVRDGDLLRRTVVDVGALPEVLEVATAPAAQHEALTREFTELPFRLADGLPLRALLLGSGEAARLVVCVHHSAFDGWSATVFFSDLGSAYAHLPAHEAGPGRVRSDYEEIWRRQCDGESERERDELLTWARDLVDVPDLPLPDGPVPKGCGALAEQVVTLPAETVRLVADAARARATTPNAVLLTAWVRALRALTGGVDFAVGLPVSGRTSPQSLAAIGCFTSVAPVRFRSSGSALDDLDRTVASLAKVLRFQFLPLERIVGESKPRDSGRTPLCQAAFVSQEQTDLSLELGSTVCEFVPRLKARSAFEVTLEVWFGQTITGRIRYRADVLEPVRAALLADLWRAEVGSIAGAVDGAGQ